MKIEIPIFPGYVETNYLENPERFSVKSQPHLLISQMN